MVWENNFEVLKDSADQHYITIKNTDQYGPVFEQKAEKLKGRHLIFEMTYINPSEAWITEITANANDGVNTLYYKSISMMLHHTNSPKKLRCMFVLPEGLNAEDVVKCHLYNGRGNEITAYGFSVLSYW